MTPNDQEENPFECNPEIHPFLSPPQLCPAPVIGGSHYEGKRGPWVPGSMSSVLKGKRRRKGEGTCRKDKFATRAQNRNGSASTQKAEAVPLHL